MIYAERGNRVIQIKEDEIQRYVDDGYKIVDDKGAVIHETVPTDIPTLKQAFRKHIEEIKSLKAQIESLQTENAQLKAKKSEVKVETKSEDEPKPKTTRAKKADAE